MTTPNGAIKFHATSGSDTQASGLGPATALYGSGASTDGTAVVTGITTTGVSAGDLLWVQTASGRQFSIIASVDSGTQVTCDDTFTLGSGQTWAIGGKRATWDNASSRQLFTDAGDKGWTVETESDQTLTSEIDMSGTGVITIRGAGSTLRTITQTVNEPHFNQGDANGLRGTTFQYLKGVNSFGGTKTLLASFIYHPNGGIYTEPFTFEYCELGDATNSLYHGVCRSASAMYCNFYDCYIHDCISDGVLNGATSNAMRFERCIVSSNGGNGVYTSGVIASNAPTSVFYYCLFRGNSLYGVCLNTLSPHYVIGSAFYGNGSSGLYAYAGSSAQIIDSVFSDNTTYGVDDSTGYNTVYFRMSGCIFYNNTSGNMQTGPIPSGNYEANTDDPFTDAANSDFSLSTGTDATALKSAAGSLFDGATETRPFRWLDTSTGGAAGSSRLVNGGLVD